MSPRTQNVKKTLVSQTRREQIRLLGSTHLPSGIDEHFLEGRVNESLKADHMARQRINRVYQTIEMIKVRSQIKQLLFEGKHKMIKSTFNMLKDQIISHSDETFQDYVENEGYRKITENDDMVIVEEPTFDGQINERC